MELSERNEAGVRLVLQLVTLLSEGDSPGGADIDMALALCAEADRATLTLALLHMTTTHVVALRHFGMEPTHWVETIGRKLG